MRKRIVPLQQCYRTGCCTSSTEHNEDCHTTPKVTQGLHDECLLENTAVVINGDNYDRSVNFPDKCSGGDVLGGDINFALDSCGRHLATLHHIPVKVPLSSISLQKLSADR